MEKISLVDVNGQPLRYTPAHNAASRNSDELASWNANEYSADGALLPELVTLRNRTKDVIRNDGVMSGAVQTHLDNIIGSGLRLNSKPDWAILGLKDAKAQREWERMTQAKFCNWAYSQDNCIDASRRMRFPALLAQAYRSYLTSFEILATAEWLPEPGKKYATAIQMIDPARLSNPQGQMNTNKLRAGVALGNMGEPLGYNIASALLSESFINTGAPLRSWKYVPKETPWGRKLVLHHYDTEEPGQSRGKNGFVSVLAKSKMLEKFKGVTLQASILNAMYAAVISSNLDWQTVGTAVGAGEQVSGDTEYMNNVTNFHGDNGIRFNGVKIPHLYPNEKLELMSPQHPVAAFESFERAVLRHMSAGANLTYEQLSRDYSQTNYSGARAGMLEVWRFFNGKHVNIAAPFATDIYSLWLEEAIDLGEVELPAGTPDFYEEKHAWCGCKWIGPGRSHIDPEKEANATKMEYGLCLTTLEKEASARGEDWEDLLLQRQQEHDRMVELGIDPQAIMLAAMNAKPSSTVGKDGIETPAAPAAAPAPAPAKPKKENANA